MGRWPTIDPAAPRSIPTNRRSSTSKLATRPIPRHRAASSCSKACASRPTWSPSATASCRPRSCRRSGSTGTACIRRRRRPSPSCAPLPQAAGIDLTLHRFVSVDRGTGRPQATQAEPVGDARARACTAGASRSTSASTCRPSRSATGLRVAARQRPGVGWFLGRPKDEPWHWVYRGRRGAAARGRRGRLPPSADAWPAARPAGSSTSTSCVACSDSMPRPATRAVRRGGAWRSKRRTSSPTTASSARARRRRCSARPLPAERPELRQGATGDVVRWVQLRVGCVPDGKFGPATERAVREFQTRQRTRPTTASSARRPGPR